MRLGAVPGHMTETLAVVALDVLGLGLVTVSCSSATVELLVLGKGAPSSTTLVSLTTLPEASEAAPAPSEASVTAHHPLFPLLLLLPKPLDLLLFLVISSQIVFDELFHRFKTVIVGNLQLMIPIVYLLLTFLDELFNLGRKRLEMLPQLYPHPINRDVLHLVVKLELVLAPLLGEDELILFLLLQLGTDPLDFSQPVQDLLHLESFPSSRRARRRRIRRG